MGTVVNFTLFQTDNDPAAGDADRQRIGMSPTILKATLNTNSYVYNWWWHVYSAGPHFNASLNTTNYIYSWWFKLNPTKAPLLGSGEKSNTGEFVNNISINYQRLFTLYKLHNFNPGFGINSFNIL